MKHSTLATTAAGVGVATIFGFSFLFTKTALGIMKPLDLIGIRFALAALMMTLLALFGLVKIHLDIDRFLSLLPLATLQPVAYFFCETVGIKMTSASEAGMIIGSIPVIVALLAAFLLHERPNLVQFICILLSTIGVAMMVAGSGTGNHAHFIGMLFLVGAVLSASFFNILSRKLSKTFTPMEMTFAMMWVGALIFNAIAFINHWINGSFADYNRLADSRAWLPLLYLSVISSVIAFFLMNYMLSRIKASESAAFINLTTLVSILAGFFVLREPILPYQIVGGLLILFGVWGTQRFAQPS